MNFHADPLYHSLAILHAAAMERGDLEAAIALGWSLIRRGGELIDTPYRQAKFWQSRGIP